MGLENRLERKKVTVKLEKSFTRDADFGSPSGIVLDADDMTEAQMLKTAQALGFPESGFLSKSDKSDARLRFFSVRQEVKACVTATLAAAHILMKLHKLRDPSRKASFETLAGIREAFVRQDNLFLLKQPKVKFSPEREDRDEIAKLLGIGQNRLAKFPIVPADAGTPKVLIPVMTLKDLFDITPDLEGIAAYCKSIGARGFYPFTFETVHEGSDFHARQFNPQDGIAEDPVTGVAAGALAAYLQRYIPQFVKGKNRLAGEQGHIIKQPGKIIIELDGQDIYVGGYVTDAGEKQIEV